MGDDDDNDDNDGMQMNLHTQQRSEIHRENTVSNVSYAHRIPYNMQNSEYVQ